MSSWDGVAREGRREGRRGGLASERVIGALRQMKAVGMDAGEGKGRRGRGRWGGKEGPEQPQIRPGAWLGGGEKLPKREFENLKFTWLSESDPGQHGSVLFGYF